VTAASTVEQTAPTILSVDQLRQLDDEALADYIADVLHIGDAWRLLNRPEVVRRTVTALGVLENDLGQTRVEKRGELSEADFEQWRTSVNTPTLGWIRRRRARAERAAHHYREQRFIAQRRAYRATVGRLGAAIREHQHRLLETGVEPEEHDRELWALLDTEVAFFDGVEYTVADALKQGLFTATGGQ
jgi:hypothetical protein